MVDVLKSRSFDNFLRWIFHVSTVIVRSKFSELSFNNRAVSFICETTVQRREQYVASYEWQGAFHIESESDDVFHS